MQIDLLLGGLSFTGGVLLLVGIIIAARSQLVSSGEVSITTAAIPFCGLKYELPTIGVPL